MCQTVEHNVELCYPDGFIAHLYCFQFCFLLNLFSDIFKHSGVLFATVLNKPLDVVNIPESTAFVEQSLSAQNIHPHVEPFKTVLY